MKTGRGHTVHKVQSGQFSSKLDVKRFDKVKLCPLVG